MEVGLIEKKNCITEEKNKKKNAIYPKRPYV